MKKKSHIALKPAFTLAEILIALAIVGVVAALVIPQIMTSINEMSWAKAKDNFYAKIDETTRQMNVNSDLPSGTNITTATFVDNLQRYMKISKRCSSTNLTDCFVSTFKNSGGTDVTTSGLTDGTYLGHSTWTQPTMGLSLADGTNAIVSYNPSCAYLDWVSNEGSIYSSSTTGQSFIPGNTTSCVAIVYDINGNQKPNVVGKDIGELNAVLGGDDCVQVGSMCVSKADIAFNAIDTTTDKTYDSSICGTGVSENIYCADNRWAGAKKACADLGWRLPNINELKLLWQASNKNAGIKSVLNMTSYYYSSTDSTNVPRYAYYSFFPYTISGAAAPKNSSMYLARCVK
ncbi:MAG: prepilin-type N-terminal cleavage/methylation domain-containing protein [Candidatus Gastranaerophilales bacterium]|nr:prepilin-type N-terminal cleavage/methylation domain-containing protein [Candidatus Gastranaerophilales bacterium]